MQTVLLLEQSLPTSRQAKQTIFACLLIRFFSRFLKNNQWANDDVFLKIMCSTPFENMSWLILTHFDLNFPFILGCSDPC